MFAKRPSSTTSFFEEQASKSSLGASGLGVEHMGEFLGDGPEKRESAVAAIETATKSFLESRWHRNEDDVELFSPTSEREYPVADLLGRCFLRVCFWADLFSSWTRRGRPLQFRALPGHAIADPLVGHESTIPMQEPMKEPNAPSLGG